MNIGVGDLIITPVAKKYVNNVLDSNQLSYGRYTRAFEKEFASFQGVKYAVFMNSGTSALQVAIHALKIKYGWIKGEILCPSVTFVASANTIKQNGLKPVFVDVDPHDGMIDPKKIEEKITPKTLAIMVVHLYGQSADMTPIMRLAKKHKLVVIEDACEATGASYKGKMVGTFGTVSCFSTFSAHTLITGVGGFVCTNDPKIERLSRSLMNHGRDMTKRNWFTFDYVGYSYRATEMEAALGLGQLKNLKKEIKQRRLNGNYLRSKLAILPLGFPRLREGYTFMMFPMITPERDQLISYLEKKGIETRPLLPLTNQPIYKTTAYPVANTLNDHAFYIGCHPNLKKAELDYIVSTFKEYFR